VAAVPIASHQKKIILNIEGKLTKNPQIVADTFNNYLSEVVDQSVINIIKQDHSQIKQHTYWEYLVHEFHQPFPSVHFKPVTEKEICEINKSLNWRNSCGCDEVLSRIVKLSMPFISSPLIYICNRMLSMGTFPTHVSYMFKILTILLIFKKGNKVEISAYRPISLSTSFFNIF
jgi:hypothetical protein